MPCRISAFVLTGAIVLMMTSVSCTSSGDPYLRSLRLSVQHIDPVDSVSIDDYAIIDIRDAISVDDDWLLLSTSKGEHALMFLNPVTSDFFMAIRRGRGPGEILSGTNLQKSGDRAVIYDFNGGVCTSVNLNETIRTRTAVLDTIGNFRDKAPKPVYIGICGKDGFVSGNSMDETVWYSFFGPEGNILSSVAAFGYKELSAYDRDYILSWHLSSKYVSNPSGTRVCVANVASPTLSFSKVDSGMMTEYKRYEIAPPQARIDNILDAFHGIAADDKYVYLIYSGHKPRGDVLPSNACNDLIVYDWEGNPVKHYHLSRHISSVHVAGGCLIGTSDHPDCKVYKYILPDLS